MIDIAGDIRKLIADLRHLLAYFIVSPGSVFIKGNVDIPSDCSYQIGGVNMLTAASTPPIVPATPKMAMWVWVSQYDTQAEADALIEFASGSATVSGKITDLYMAVQNDYPSPKVVMGQTTKCNKTSTLFGSLTPYEYIVQQAHAAGIRVHAWWVIYPWAYWGGATAALATPLTDNGTNHDTSGGGSTINFSTAAVRTALVDAMAEFHTLNGDDGINLDYIRTDGLVTGQTDEDVSSLVGDLRAGTTAEISVCALSVYEATSHHQDVATWLTSDYIDTVAVMAYYTNAAAKLYKWDNWNLAGGKTLLVGIGTEEASGTGSLNCTKASDTRASFRQYSLLGYKNFCLFNWGDSIYLPVRQAPVQEYLLGNIDTTAPYPSVSSVTVTPGTSFSLTIGGTVYTTLNSDCAAYTQTGTLKGYIESLQGQRPWIHYERPTSSTVKIIVGDFEV
jgi:hypothetical protein